MIACLHLTILQTIRAVLNAGYITNSGNKTTNQAASVCLKHPTLLIGADHTEKVKCIALTHQGKWLITSRRYKGESRVWAEQSEERNPRNSKAWEERLCWTFSLLVHGSVKPRLESAQGVDCIWEHFGKAISRHEGTWIWTFAWSSTSLYTLLKVSFSLARISSYCCSPFDFSNICKTTLCEMWFPPLPLAPFCKTSRKAQFINFKLFTQTPLPYLGIIALPRSD